MSPNSCRTPVPSLYCKRLEALQQVTEINFEASDGGIGGEGSLRQSLDGTTPFCLAECWVTVPGTATLLFYALVRLFFNHISCTSTVCEHAVARLA